MTWYWWTHWFWITSLSAVITCYSFGSVHTPPSSSTFNHGKIYSKGDTLKFPIAVQSYSDDIIDGRELLEAKFHEEWNPPDKRLKNVEKDEKDLKDIDKNASVVDIYSELLVDHVGNSSKEFIPVNNTYGSNKYDSTDTKTDTENFRNSIQSNIPITKISQMNMSTVVPIVEKITKLKSISTKSQFSRPEVYLNKQNGSELTTEHVVVREDTEKQVINDRGRQSTILASYSETLKIVNFTSASKNLLARSAISISSDELVGDEELNSEAVIIKASVENAEHPLL